MARFDVVIVGGGVIGCSTAYFLASEPGFQGTIAVIERDPTYEKAATPRSAGGFRQQFSTPENIRISSFGAQFYKSIANHLSVEGEAPDIGLREGGYLFLATEAGHATLAANTALQRELGAATELLDQAQLAARFPWLNVEELAGGGHGAVNEGWVDPYSLLQAYRRKARSLGVAFLTDEAVGFAMQDNRVTAVKLASGAVAECGIAVNAAGYRARAVAAWAGIDLPVHPRKRLVYVFDCRDAPSGVPLTVDPNGTWFRPEGAGFICGISPPEDQDPDCLDFELTYDQFEDVIWPTLAHRVPVFEAIKLTRAWAGHYDYNVLDQNVLIGPAPAVPNLHFANGFSGHGLQQSPGIGRALSELIAFGKFRTLDLSRLSFERVARGEPVLEANVV